MCIQIKRTIQLVFTSFVPVDQQEFEEAVDHAVQNTMSLLEDAATKIHEEHFELISDVEFELLVNF